MNRLRPEELKYPVLLQNINGMIVIALGLGLDSELNVRCKILDNAGSNHYRDGQIVVNCLLSLFEKYDASIRLANGTVLKNV